MSKKNIYLIVLGIITIFCITFGIYRSSKQFMGKIKWSNGFHFDFDFDDDDDEIEEKNDYSEVLEKFDEIEIDSQILSIEIVNSKDYGAYANFNKESLKPSLKIQNGKLYVSQNIKKGKTFGNNNASLRITVPEDVELSNLYVNNNVGAVYLNKISVDKIKISNNVGEISIKDCIFSKLTADTNVGEIELNNSASYDDYEIRAKTDVGELNVLGKSYKHSYNQNGTDSKSIELNTNVGEISIK